MTVTVNGPAIGQSGAVSVDGIDASTISAATWSVTADGLRLCAATLSADTTISLPAPINGLAARRRLMIVQDSSGGRVALFPTASWAAGSEPIPPTAASEWGIYEFITLDGGASWRAHVEVAPATAPTLFDRFARADSASSLGTAEVGGAWTANAGTWGITGGAAYLVSSTSNAVATLDAAKANKDIGVSVTIAPTGNSQPGIIYRYTDASNYSYLIVGVNGVTWSAQLWNCVAGSFTNQINTTISAMTRGAANSVRLSVVGNAVVVTVNGTQVISTTVTANAAATRCGFYKNDTSAARYDNFLVL